MSTYIYIYVYVYIYIYTHPLWTSKQKETNSITTKCQMTQTTEQQRNKHELNETHKQHNEQCKEHTTKMSPRGTGFLSGIIH